VADLYEVLLVHGGTRWSAGFLVDDATETDVLLRDAGRVPLFGSRAALEHFLQESGAQERGVELQDDLPDEIDLDLGGWLTGDGPQPTTAEVLQLWQLLLDDPDAAPRAVKGISGAAVEDAYDDLTDDEHDWWPTHGDTARTVLADAVRRLRGVLAPG
jgi:hypothetical protein